MRSTSKPKNMPQFGSLDELVEFFDTQDMGDYLEKMPVAAFEVNLKKKKHLFVVEEDLVAKLTRIASKRRVSPEALIDSWIREKIQGKP